jgi:PAS domain S-box-containing protein
MSRPPNTSSSPVVGARVAPGEEQFRIFVESVRDYAMLILDTDGRVATWNRGAEAIKGWTAGEIVGQHFSRFYPAESIAAGLPERELTGAARDGRFEDEGWRIRKDGSRFWANVIITALRDADDKLIGYAKVTRDLTERRRHEESLRQNEARFRSLVEGVRDYAIFMLDTEGRVTTWNAGAQHIMGYDAVEAIGEHLSTFYPQDGRQRDLAELELQTAMIEGRFEDEGWRVRKDGSRFWASVILTAVRNPTGVLVGFSKITRDLTERRKHESTLRESEERIRLLVESVIDYSIITVDEDGFVNSWNLGAERITGFTGPEIIGRHFSHLYPPEDIASNKPWQQLVRANEGTRVSEESWRVRKDGSQFWANSVIGKLASGEGPGVNFYIVTQDLTQRRHAESLADTAQKMHEFIAMLAHELRNPLAPIRNAVALMHRRNIQDPIVESMRQTIERQSGQLARIIDELLDVNRVARGQFTIEKETLDLREILQRSIETSRPLIEARQHKLDVDMGDAAIPVHADPLRMQQVVVNLLNNAAKYTSSEGTITLQARTIDGHAEIRVRDTGKGIPRDALDRVFDLFIQLEPNSGSALGGLGVGLALVRRIVELHGGRVYARSEGLGRGAEFNVRLPLSQTAITTHMAEGTPDPTFSSTVRVLVVDDNVDAADSLTLMLQSAGQEARAVYDAATALRLVETYRPHLILLDIGMPQMNGYDVARAIRAAPTGHEPVIAAVSGWGQEADKARAAAAGFDRHFTKPIAESALRALVAEATERRVTRIGGTTGILRGPS